MFRSRLPLHKRTSWAQLFTSFLLSRHEYFTVWNVVNFVCNGVLHAESTNTFKTRLDKFWSITSHHITWRKPGNNLRLSCQNSTNRDSKCNLLVIVWMLLYYIVLYFWSIEEAGKEATCLCSCISAMCVQSVMSSFLFSCVTQTAVVTAVLVLKIKSLLLSEKLLNNFSIHLNWTCSMNMVKSRLLSRNTLSSTVIGVVPQEPTDNQVMYCLSIWHWLIYFTSVLDFVVGLFEIFVNFQIVIIGSTNILSLNGC